LAVLAVLELVLAFRGPPAAGAQSAAAPAGLEPAQTYAVIVGVLEWPSKSLAAYSKENRRDQGLYDTLKARGVPESHMCLLLDQKATEANMLKALTEVADLATKDATFIFYYAGHGYPGSEGIYFACYDAGMKNGPKEGFLLRNVSTILNRHYQGRQVLLLGECCYSGGLGLEAETLAHHGFAAASLTAASIGNQSTDQWTFTCCIIDALAGRSLLDHDGDGSVSLQEAADEVRDAMNFIESQNCGVALRGLPDSFRLAPVKPDKAATPAIPAPYALGQYVKLDGRGKRKAARIVDFRDGQLQLEIQRYNERESVWAAPGRVTALKRPELPAPPATPAALDARQAEEKAAVGGKYSHLLEKVPAPFDYVSYGAFSDYGRWEQTEYVGRAGLPRGYWVYVYPNWYIFDYRREGAGNKQAPEKARQESTK
jgi:hypothetical protein